jgi:uncharacterized protein YndB with AHSA1/START domain
LTEIVLQTFQTSRLFIQTPEAVFAAIADPVRLARWWGPSGFTNAFEIFEFVEGGRWVLDMIGPDGTRYPNESVFTRIEPGRQVVIEHVCEPLFRLTITLDRVPEGTLVQWVQVFADPVVAQAVRHMVEPANEQNLDRWGFEIGLSSDGR